MKVLRTPEKCFKGLKNYPYKPNYTTIKTKEGDNLRIHHIDVGPKEGPVSYTHLTLPTSDLV